MAGLTVLLVVVWVASGWRYVSWLSSNGAGLAVDPGQIVIVQSPAGGPPSGQHSLRFTRHEIRWNWSIDWGTAGTNPFLAIPLWLPALLSVLATAAAWRADAKYLRRVREGTCPACGYDRAGLAAGAVCPECGKQPEAR